MDEPFSTLDLEGVEALARFVRESTASIIHHPIERAAAPCDRAVMLENGLIVGVGMRLTLGGVAAILTGAQSVRVIGHYSKRFAHRVEVTSPDSLSEPFAVLVLLLFVLPLVRTESLRRHASGYLWLGVILHPPYWSSSPCAQRLIRRHDPAAACACFKHKFIYGGHCLFFSYC